MPKVKHEFLSDKILILLSQRNDVTRLGLIELLNKSEAVIDMTLVNLRKKGFKIYPSKGAGSPLRIATTKTQCENWIKWRRNRFLPTTKRMVVSEQDVGEIYPILADKKEDLLEQINNATNQNNAI